jgi:DNA polymerase-3 subunit beta
MTTSIHTAHLSAMLATAAARVAKTGGAWAHLRITGTPDSLTINGSDGTTHIQTTAHVTDGDTFDVLAPPRLAHAAVTAIRGDTVQIAVEDGEMAIRSGRQTQRIRLSTLPASDLPALGTTRETGTVEVGAALFAAALRRVVVAASEEDTRPIITGVLLSTEGDGLRMVATDSYRLAISDIPGVSIGLAPDATALVPANALALIAKWATDETTVGIHIGDRSATFTVGTTTMQTRLIEGEYPAYRRLIPADSPTTTFVDGQVLSAAIKSTTALSSDGATPVRLEIGDFEIGISRLVQDVGSSTDSTECVTKGPNLTAAVNGGYLRDGLAGFESGEVQISFIDGLKPLVVRQEGSGYIYLMMPIKA